MRISDWSSDVCSSDLSLARNALTGQRDWQRYWRNPAPKPSYDVVIVGGGGHGPAIAHYLAKEHGVANVAVLEKGWIGGAKTGRNTTTTTKPSDSDSRAIPLSSDIHFSA